MERGREPPRGLRPDAYGMGVAVSKEIVRRRPLLLPCRLPLAAQQYKNVFFHLKIDLTKIVFAGLGGAIAAARPVTPIGMLEVNYDNSTHRAPEDVWFGP